MGVDLVPVGNHKIRFKDKSFIEVANEITTVLNQATFPNAQFLKDFARRSNKYFPEMIREVESKQHWTYKIRDEYYESEGYRSIDLYGPFDLILTFEDNFIRFGNPRYRFWSWFEYDQLHQNEWRKYMYFIVNLFGGNRVLYAADSSNFLEKYAYYEGSFEEMERELLEKYGKSQKSIGDIGDFGKDYLIDDFKSIDWNHEEVFDEPQPKPGYNLSLDNGLDQFADKENLKQYYFFDYDLRHKIIDNKIHFYHLSTVDRLICIHTGIVGDEENIEVIFDEKIQLAFYNLLDEIKEDGYSIVPDKNYIIYFKGQENYDGWKDTLNQFKSELIWSGLGMSQRSYRIINNEEYGLHIYIVDEEQALKLLLDLGEKNSAKGKFIFYYNEEDYTSFDYNDQNVTNNKVIYKHC